MTLVTLAIVLAVLVILVGRGRWYRFEIDTPAAILLLGAEEGCRPYTRRKPRWGVAWRVNLHALRHGECRRAFWAARVAQRRVLLKRRLGELRSTQDWSQVGEGNHALTSCAIPAALAPLERRRARREVRRAANARRQLERLR